MSEFFNRLPAEEAAVAYRPREQPAPDSPAATAARRGEAQLLAIDGVEGVGSSGGCVEVYVRDAEVVQRLPADIDGIPVHARVTGQIVAYDSP